MNKRNFIATIVGLSLLLLPIFSLVLRNLSINPIIQIGRNIIQPLFPSSGIWGGLVSEFIYLFIVGIVIALISAPKKYFLIPIIILIVAVIDEIVQYNTWGDFQIASAFSAFISMMIFISLGFALARNLSFGTRL